jgi:hypothetical protein
MEVIMVVYERKGIILGIYPFVEEKAAKIKVQEIIKEELKVLLPTQDKETLARYMIRWMELKTAKQRYDEHYLSVFREEIIDYKSPQGSLF